MVFKTTTEYCLLIIESNLYIFFILARVKGTGKQIEELEKLADENMQLTRDAKMKVGLSNNK